MVHWHFVQETQNQDGGKKRASENLIYMFNATISFQALLLLHSINLDALCFHFVTYGVLAIEWLPLNFRFILSACSMVMEHILTIFSLPTGIEAFLVDMPEKCCKKKRGSLPDSFVLA